jgi:putative redox protein
LDEPTDGGGSDTGPDPVSAFLGALMSCLTIAFRATARRRKVAIERIEGHVRANPTGQVKDIRLTLEVWTPADEEQLRALLEPAKRSCYVSRMLKPELGYRLELSVHRPE